MKFNCGPSPEAKRALKLEAENKEQLRLTNWHSFFALWPRRVGENDCRFLEQIERRGTMIQKVCFAPFSGRLAYYWGYRWQYRAKQGTTE